MTVHTKKIVNKLFILLIKYGRDRQFMVIIQSFMEEKRSWSWVVRQDKEVKRKVG